MQLKFDLSDSDGTITVAKLHFSCLKKERGDEDSGFCRDGACSHKVSHKNDSVFVKTISFNKLVVMKRYEKLSQIVSA